MFDALLQTRNAIQLFYQVFKIIISPSAKETLPVQQRNKTRQQITTSLHNSNNNQSTLKKLKENKY